MIIPEEAVPHFENAIYFPMLFTILENDKATFEKSPFKLSKSYSNLIDKALNQIQMTGYGSTRSSDQDISIVVPSDLEVLTNSLIFKFENGQLIKDVEYQKELIANYQEPVSELELLRRENTDLKKDNEMNAIALMELAERVIKGGV